jgi:hypothetical protein
VTELPQDDQTARDLDHGIEPEPDQGYRTGHDARSDRYDGLNHVVRDRASGQYLGSAPEPLAQAGVIYPLALGPWRYGQSFLPGHSNQTNVSLLHRWIMALSTEQRAARH